MSYFIAIQYPYEYVSISLSDNTTILTSKTISKFQAAGLLIPTIDSILQEQNLKLAHDIACIGINTGPGPFNTLRSIIATANGISFAKHIPLAGSNGLDLLLENTTNNSVAVLDAFGHDVYYSSKLSGLRGYSSIENFVAQLNSLNYQDTINFFGNGAIKHKEFITTKLNTSATFDELSIFPSMQSLINSTYNRYSQGLTEKELFPLYFATPFVK
jgi:tRNA threonylcarbamoyl adenosine modification protein YeaZ